MTHLSALTRARDALNQAIACAEHGAPGCTMQAVADDGATMDAWRFGPTRVSLVLGVGTELVTVGTESGPDDAFFSRTHRELEGVG